MRLLVIIFCLLFNQVTFSQEDREAIKIDVDKDCKSSINKRTFENEIYTKPVRIVNTLNTVVTLTFSYKENFIYEDKGPVLNLWLNDEFLTRYDTKHIYLTIDGEEFDLYKLIEFETYETTLNNKTLSWWGLGFYMNQELTNAFDNATNIELAMIASKSRERRIWKLNPALVKNIVEAYDCFVQYYTPIDNKLKEERKIANEEYERNLKAFEKNYRDSKWYDSKVTVKSTQTTEISLDKDNALAYKVRLNNDDFLAFYYFNNDRLYQGVYVLDEDYVNENNFYSKYKEIKRILISKYGEPKRVSKHRSRDLYDGVDEIGMAIQTGEYTEYTSWETKNTTIMLIIEGENFDSKLTIRYKTKDPELRIEADKDNKQKQQEGF